MAHVEQRLHRLGVIRALEDAGFSPATTSRWAGSCSSWIRGAAVGVRGAPANVNGGWVEGFGRVARSP